MTPFTDIPIEIVAEIISANQKIYVCQLFEMINYFKKKRVEKVGKNKIYEQLAVKYNLSSSAIRKIFYRKLTKILNTYDPLPPLKKK